MHSMLRGIYMLLWDTNSLRDNLQTAADVKNKRGPASLFPYIYLIDSYNTSFGVHFDFSRKSELISRVSPFPCIGTFVFYPLACKEFVLVHREGNNQARNQGGCTGCIRTPPQASKVRILILNIQFKECSRLN